MASFRRGIDHIKQAAERNSGPSAASAQMITWKSGDKKYIQFVTPLEEIPTVLYHAFMNVGTNDYGKPKYRSFISRKDSALDGESGYDPIVDRFGLTPKSRCLAVAVELEPVYERSEGQKKVKGFTVATREDRDGKEVPAAGLIIQSPLTFFGTLTSYAEDWNVTDTVFKVVRRGGDQNTAYDFIPSGKAIDLSDVELPDLDTFLEELSDEKRIREYIDHLPDEWILDRFQQKDGPTGKAARSTPAAVEAVAPGADETPPWDPPAQTTDAPARSKRFKALKAEIES